MIDLKYSFPGTLKWDLRFLRLAMVVASWSKDPSTKVGAVIVRPDKSVASVGFNGFPQNMPDYDELYLNREEKLSRIIHAEINALNFCVDSNLHNYVLYTTFVPCDRCFVTMAQAGIKTFIAPEPTSEQTSRWGASLERTKKYAAEMHLELVLYPMTEILKDQ